MTYPFPFSNENDEKHEEKIILVFLIVGCILAPKYTYIFDNDCDQTFNDCGAY